jgi:hypothetical protein
VSWIRKTPHVFNTTSWRCPPWQSRHCCHLPDTLATTRRSMSCVTFAVSWQIAFLGLLMFLWGYLKAQVFTHTLPDINSLKNGIPQEFANVTQDTLRRVMASVPGRWQHCLYCHAGHLQDVVLKTWGFMWIQDTDLLDRVQLYLLLCTVNELSYFQNG